MATREPTNKNYFLLDLLFKALVENFIIVKRKTEKRKKIAIRGYNIST